MKVSKTIRTTKAKGKTTSRKKKIAREHTFPVVAIGASAGGLEAMSQLLKNLPGQTGMAFIYVQHLSPDHKSILVSILSKISTMKVQEVTNKVRLEPNKLFIIPPDKEMVLIDGHIKLTPRVKHPTLNLPIDTFFCSLASICKEKAIGIILSGSASDGTIGLGAIKQNGGLTFAQDDSAKFGSMPKSAVAAGAVDFVLSPREMAKELVRLSKHGFIRRKAMKLGKEVDMDDKDPDLKIILNFLLTEKGVDFSHYKLPTIKRRILRRMLLYKIDSVKEYAKLMTEKKDELTILFQDLLINVTGFFRDTESYGYLKSTLLPRLLKSKTSDEILRIWIPACSTGQEVYSIAMMLLEIQGSNQAGKNIQIFATDLSQEAVAKARIGEYSRLELESVSPKRLRRFYIKSGTNYRVSKNVRDLCVFAPHNILNDPPFSHIDFISCCNLLIYLDAVAQKKVISTFHYALNANGYLMLGKAESIGASAALFRQVNSKYKIYLRKEGSGRRALPEIGRVSAHLTVSKQPAVKSIKGNGSNFEFNGAVEAILLSKYVPASVVINYTMDILQFRGATDLFLRHPTGKATLNILKLISPEVSFELRSLINKAIKSKRNTIKHGIEILIDKDVRNLTIEVAHVTPEDFEPLLLVLFSEPEKVETFVLQGGKKGKSNNSAKDRKISQLKKELSEVRSDMYLFTKEQEAFNDQLQNASEEVVSSNEELQSVNEELETSKEEVESANEELITTNQELQTRNDLLHESYEYSEAIIATIHEPMVILDKDLRVKSANHAFYRSFHVTKEETESTLLYDLGNKQWDIPQLRLLLEDIIPKNSRFHDFEVSHTFKNIGKKIMLLNASRLLQKSAGDHLILLAINDITERATLQLREHELLQKDLSKGKSYSLRLEMAVDERTKELERLNETLAGKNEELEKMNKELEAFTYVSSHDLQEPMRKIQTFSMRILETENVNLSEKGKDYFVRLKTAAARMQKLIEDLLAFSRLSASERTYEPADLAEIVKEVRIELKEVIKEKKVEIRTEYLHKLKLIHFQFRQLMFNLIGNAIKFSDPKRPLLVIIRSEMVSKVKPSGIKFIPGLEYCHISVSDNGIGFDTQYKERIFDVFQKLHGKQEYPGNGIGLAIVKRIVENHNGFISVESKLGKGTTFNLYIPTNLN